MAQKGRFWLKQDENAVAIGGGARAVAVVVPSMVPGTVRVPGVVGRVAGSERGDEHGPPRKHKMPSLVAHVPLAGATLPFWVAV
eukprot:CAMPEP_0171760358 /NCGR_PEP_ID=MMETSP0991-20121206/47427_1 /TAXON_ID=483369 /ORGANISM="non described non described, Strain CCMP2098" /LENGTH=83 /DNA_ID=CAMNT_0012363443 /DNA_START=264 /DNA_END=515 /DNA_ORIENTATION=+